MKWDIKSVRVGEEKKSLEDGWEPFGVVTHDASYYFYNTTKGRDEFHRQATDRIYLRKMAPS